MRKVIIGLAAAALFVAPQAYADDAPGTGPSVKGGIQMNVEAAQDVAAAVGNEAEADQELGNIDSGNIVGDVEMGISAEEDVAAAVGNESTAKQKVGTIGGQ